MTFLSARDIALMHETVIQVANATLTAIEAPGPLAGNGDPGDPVSVWTGFARAFLDRVDEDILSQDIEVTTTTVTLIVFDEAGAPAELLVSGADWAASTVVVSDERLAAASVMRWTVIGVTHEADGTMDHVLLTLNDPRAVS